MKELQAQFLELEKKLADPALRREPQFVASLLADEFLEFGSSGRAYNKEEIIAALLHHAAGEIVVNDFKMLLVGEHTALVTYKASVTAGQDVTHTLRSSLWLQREGRWQIIFHQGTPAAK